MTSELKIDTGYLIFTKISFIYLYKVMLQSLQVMLQLLQVSMLDYIVCFRTIPDPGSQKLNWHKPPLTVLVIKKMHDENALSAFTQLVKWLIQVKRNKGVRKTFWLSGFYYTCTPIKLKVHWHKWFRLLSHKDLNYTPANEVLRWEHFRITQCFYFCLSVCWQVLSTYELRNFCIVNG